MLPAGDHRRKLRDRDRRCARDQVRDDFAGNPLEQTLACADYATVWAGPEIARRTDSAHRAFEVEYALGSRHARARSFGSFRPAGRAFPGLGCLEYCLAGPSFVVGGGPNASAPVDVWVAEDFEREAHGPV